MGCFPSKKKATEEEPVAPPAEPPFLPTRDDDDDEENHGTSTMTPAESGPAPAHHNIGTALTSTPEMPGYFDSSGSPDGPADHSSVPQGPEATIAKGTSEAVEATKRGKGKKSRSSSSSSSSTSSSSKSKGH